MARLAPSKATGTAPAPPSKSVTHRAFLLAALSETPSVVRFPLLSADTRATLGCLARLGARFHLAQDEVRFEPAPLRAPSTALDCANSGTTLRLLAGQCARLPQPVLLTGDASLRSRPNGPLLQALHALGARVRSNDGKAPLTVHGPLRAGDVALPPGTSSQFASSLLLALALTPGASTLLPTPPVASRPYLDLTVRMAQAAACDVAWDGDALRIHGQPHARLSSCSVEGDWSAAAFLLAAAAVTGGDVTVTHLAADSLQGDAAIAQHLAAFGAAVEAVPDGVRVRGGPLTSPGTIDVHATPDLFPALAVVAAAAKGTTTFTGGASLRDKESDRIAAMAEGLAAMGVRCTERTDGLTVTGAGRPLRAARLQAHGDHRIHMAFAVAALAADGPCQVEDAESAAVSFPGFHAALDRLCGGVEVAA